MVNTVDFHVGQKLKRARKALRMSQSDVARELGLSFQQVQKYETGANRISASCLYQVSRVLNVPTGYFFEGLDEDEPQHDKRDLNAEIAAALSSVKDERLQERIMSYIHHVGAVQGSRYPA